MIVSLRQVSKRFGDTVVIESLDLDVTEGEFLTLLGPSGCGKTTTLRMIGGFEQPSAGTIHLAGQDVTHLPPYRRDVNTVFQSYALFPHLSVARNVAYGLERKRVPRAEIDERVAEALAMVQMDAFALRKPRELSGGQQQRVAVARAIVNRPRVLLLDEPLGALDLKLRKQMQEELKALQRRLGMTFLYVTHDQEEALTMSDRIAVMRAGRIEQLAGPEAIYRRPRTCFVADFIGETNLLAGVLAPADASAGASPGASPGAPGDAGSTAYLVIEGARIPVRGVPAAPDGNGADQPSEIASDHVWHLSIRPEHVTVRPAIQGEATHQVEAAAKGDEPAAVPGAVSLRGVVAQTMFVGAVWKTRVRLPGGAAITASEPPSSHGHLAPGTEVIVSWDPDQAVLLAD